MKKAIFALALGSLLVSTPAFGGEISGNGKYVPGGANGASECSYSGLNDDPSDGFGFIQSYGWVMRLLGIVPRYFNPGDFGVCRV